MGSLSPTTSAAAKVMAAATVKAGTGTSEGAERHAEGQLQLKTRRVQMDLPPTSMQRLERLKTNLEASSYAEVMKDALKLLEYFALEDEQGSRFFIERKDGQRQELRLFV